MHEPETKAPLPFVTRQRLSDAIAERYRQGVPLHTQETQKARALLSTRRKQVQARPLTIADKIIMGALYLGGYSLSEVARIFNMGYRPNKPDHPRISRVRRVLIGLGFLQPTSRQEA